MILLVEDEAAVRKATRRILDRSGFNVVEAEDKQGALDLLTAHGDQIQLVLTDVLMPSTSGPELVAQMRQSYPSLKALFMSGHSADDVADKFSRFDTSEFLQKPFTPRVLSRRIQAMLEP